jgi:hypothetical protein
VAPFIYLGLHKKLNISIGHPIILFHIQTIKHGHAQPICNMSGETSLVQKGLSSSPSDISLWDRAYEIFACKNADLDLAFREILSTEAKRGSASPLGDLTSSNYADKEKQLSALVDRQVERMQSREWKVRLLGKSIKVRTQVERILNIVSILKDLGMQAASVDPVHAGPPVAGLCLILSV